jgi:hypothetical protein
VKVSPGEHHKLLLWLQQEEDDEHRLLWAKQNQAVNDISNEGDSDFENEET